MDARSALLNHLIDYAGLFPPAQLAMQNAAEEYGVLRQGARNWMLGRFVVPASRVFELSEVLEGLAGGGSLQAYGLSVLVDAGSDPRAWLANADSALRSVARAQGEGLPVQAEALELAVPPLLAARETYDALIAQFGMLAQNAGLRALPVFVEFPRTDAWAKLLPGAMAALARAKFGAKLRCGGLTEQAFPSSEQVAAFVRAAHEEGIAWKATAGLHHPVRHRDPQTGFVMHGFLNVLAAATFVRDGASDLEVLEMVEECDPAAFSLSDDAFSWRGRTASVRRIQETRSAGFIGYGSCSFEEPLQSLIALGMLPARTPA